MALSVHGLFDELEARRRAEREAAKRDAAAAAARQREERQRFEERPLTDDDRTLIERRIRIAFDHREKEVMLVSFPSEICADRGRRIGRALPGWEDTLPGYARRLYAHWHDVLRPGGFGCEARIISYPDGMPGDVGLFVTWPETRPDG